MKKIGQALKDIDDAVMAKTAFIPAPGDQQGGQPGGQDQGGQGGGGMEQLLSQLPPEIADQLKQLPPDQQMQALQQMMQQAGPQGGQTPPGGGQDPSAGQDPAAAQQGGQPSGQQQEKVQSSGPPTDLENSTITLRVRDLLDLVSGGNATKSTLKVQEHIQKGQMRQQQMQQKQVEDQQKKQQDAQMKQQQQQQEQAMAGQGPNMMGGGGIY